MRSAEEIEAEVARLVVYANSQRFSQRQRDAWWSRIEQLLWVLREGSAYDKEER